MIEIKRRGRGPRIYLPIVPSYIAYDYPYYYSRGYYPTRIGRGYVYYGYPYSYYTPQLLSEIRRPMLQLAPEMRRQGGAPPEGSLQMSLTLLGWQRLDLEACKARLEDIGSQLKLGNSTKQRRTRRDLLSSLGCDHRAWAFGQDLRGAAGR